MRRDETHPAMNTTDYRFRNNQDLCRYELDLGDGLMALLDYTVLPDGIVVFTHTEVPRSLMGRGIGSRLVELALHDIRNRELRVVPRCGFVADYIRRHYEWQPITAPTGRGR